jgi:hypothetical protein
VAVVRATRAVFSNLTDARLSGEVLSGPTPAHQLDSEPLEVDDDALAKVVGGS